tara:strand:+ start:336 stop:1349 length:1014 start_codon:yes stop_codon:yes gene_type:complete
MKKLFPYLLFIVLTNSSFSQIESGLLFGLTKGTTSEINAIIGMEEGQILYNSDTKALLVYNGNTWVNTENSNWLLNGNTTSNGTFLGTTNDVFMDMRSNNTSMLQLGRRQTLGLTQNFADYNDNNQYVIHVKGSNGTSALQFQADAASFYKPMFFTTAEGNFGLKGSAAGTDFFEIGSSGTNNNGSLSFTIGDDGNEPIIFNKYNYNTGTNVEMMRLQGTGLNNFVRAGINVNKNTPNSTLQVNGSISNSIIITTGNLSLTEVHHTIILGDYRHNITLPLAGSCVGRVYVIKNPFGGRGNLNGNISSFIDIGGGNSTTISERSVIYVQSDGTNWQQL